MLAYFSTNGFIGEAFCVALILCVTLIIFCLVNQEVFEPDKSAELRMVDRATSELTLNEQTKEEW